MSNDPVVRLRVPKVSEVIADHFRGSIASGELRPGDQLPRETTLLARFGVSRPTLREALRVLEAEGLIAVARGAHGGARVLTPSAGALGRSAGVLVQQRGAGTEDVVAAVVELEVSAVRTLADPRGSGALAEVTAGLTAADAADEAAEGDFHARLVASVNEVNAVLREALLATGLPHLTPTTCVAPEGAHAHARMLNLAARGDADAAERAWRVHLRRWAPSPGAEPAVARVG